MFGKEFICPVCHKKIPPHEVALFFGGKDNLMKIHIKDDYVLVHFECVEKYNSVSELVKDITNGEVDLSYLEE
ncbi:hypothetical protein TTHT_0846 [Thermotomaculum hydrothermale]|uniref:Uncharacterized protein n=1 Tax=Thermotomaculum hydrothermale TaxID=981385 RepID=A0A7R6PMQ3_9BACT|nr:hypothetical protein [Thermotomaculum hydrothermale]BBB32408.1 hypothetical protein TTHT_0846 [Thermotomaculum hydrothermale]